MRILLVTTEISPYHGYGRVALSLIKEFQKLKVDFEVVTLANAKNLLKDKSIKVYKQLRHLPTSPLINPFVLLQDYLFVNKLSQSFDLIHFLTESHLAYAVFLKKPYLVTTYGTWAIRPLASNVISRNIFRTAYNKAGAVVSISNYTRIKLEELIPEASHKVIYIGLDLPVQKSPKNLTGKVIKILSVSALNKGKDYVTALKSVINLAKENRVKYTIVSGRKSPRLKSELIQLAKKNQFNNLNIFYKLSDSKKNQLYRESDFFLLTPREIGGDIEGFGLIFLEAASWGLPIVTTESGAVPEILDALGSGLLVKEGNYKGVVDALRKIIKDKKLYQKLSSKGLSNVPKFSAERMAQKYQSLYQKILKSY